MSVCSALSAYARIRWDKGRNPDKGADYITHTPNSTRLHSRPTPAAFGCYISGQLRFLPWRPRPNFLVRAHCPYSLEWISQPYSCFLSQHNSQSRLSARQRSLESTRVQRSDFRFPCRHRQMQPSPARVAKAGGGTPAPYGHACTNCVRAKCKCMYGDHAGACERYVTSALIDLLSLPLSWTGTRRTQLDHQHNQFLAFFFSPPCL